MRGRVDLKRRKAHFRFGATILALLAGGLPLTHAGVPGGDIPATFEPRTAEFDFSQRVVMIPMRDGIRLKTFILIPRAARGAPFY